MKGWNADRFGPGRWCLLPALALILLMVAPAWGEEISVQVAVEKPQMYVGEPFAMQVQVENSDSPTEPDLSALTDFQVEARGGRQNNSDSISIVNGRMTRVSVRSYIFNYQLTPKRAGSLLIPALDVEVDGHTYRTRPLRLTAVEPQESDDFKLRLSVPQSAAYLGQAIPLTVTWYIGQQVKDIEFNLPFRSDPRFTVKPRDEGTGGRNSKDLIRIQLGQDEVIGRQGQGTLDGQTFTTVSFSMYLFPRQAGDLVLEPSTVAFQALTGYSRQRDPFGDFFNDDFFSRGRRGVYERVVIPSNTLTLQVAELPEQGKPALFTGLVGEYSLAVTASPTTVNVGDPITLTIQVAGSFVDEVELPPLGQQLPASDFKVPEERAPGQVEDVIKTFNQTIRAKHGRVSEIPALELPYFDSTTGAYGTARSQPIPITVKEAKVVTAMDAEGVAAQPEKRQLDEFGEGISHNYEGVELLKDQSAVLGRTLFTPVRLLLLAGPALLFFLVFLGRIFLGREQRQPERQRARKARGCLLTVLKEVEGHSGGQGYELLGEGLRQYLGAKLGKSGSALTFADAEPLLQSRGVEPELVERLARVFGQCEASVYAGGMAGDQELQPLVTEAREITQQIEKRL